MIAYRISDGIGNQIFQYATARVLSSLNQDAELFLDIDFFARQSSATRHYGLNRFRIKTSGFFHSEERTVTRSSQPGLSQAVDLKNFSSPLLWDPRVLTLRGDIHVQSFGQNWRHLSRIESNLRNELCIINEPEERNRSLLDCIRTTPSVSVHIRRDDYLTCGYQVCSKEYYESAMSLMREKFPGARFFIFSDTPEWAKALWGRSEDMHFVTHNTAEESCEDLRLMANCRGHIMANSTFSWWGAWLNPDPEKMVIAPSGWKMRGQSSEHMLLPGWIKL